jgi:glycerol-3-phosphate dehydrogenase
VRVAILGSGQVGQALARGWAAHGHDVVNGTRQTVVEDLTVAPPAEAVRDADLGGIEASRWLEAMCMAWVAYGARTGTWGHAFELLR